jgi:hypothetical protein
MDATTLGRLVKVELRDIWLSEATDFTPWLAREENIAVLGETLGLDLEVEAQEKAVGPFRADILCKDVGSNDWVLVENQLERTDHTHLGQLLTYASGLDAVTIVWIAARFTEEHRSTLDWLNRITDESFRFFGLEVELWRIGESPAAPKFNIVSRPNDWTKSVHQAARAIDESQVSDLRIMQRDYWSKLHEELDRLAGPVDGSRKPQFQSWMAYPVGRSGFMISAVMVRPKREIRVELYISNEDAKVFFGLLEQQKEEIERDIGYPIDWEALPEKRDSRVAIRFPDVDPEDRDDWPRQHEWMAARINDFQRVFSPRVRLLDADQWSADNQDTVPTSSTTLGGDTRFS